MEAEERFDLLDARGRPLRDGDGRPLTKARRAVHRDGDWHQAVHVWVLFQDTWELVLQQRNPDKDSWPGMWDISSAGHISAGDGALDSAQRELHEELGLQMPKEAFQPLFTYRQEFAGTFHGRRFVNNEFNHVFLVTFTAPLPREAFRLQEEEVADVKFVAFPELKRLLEAGDPDHITYLAGLEQQYRGFFDILEARRARLARGEPPLGTPRKAVVELPAGEGRGGGAAQYLEAEVLTWTYVDALEDAGRHFAMELPDFGDDGGRGGEEEESAGGAATRPMPVDW